MKNLMLTDERVIPKLMNPKSGLLKEHIARYRFAKDFVKGRVLDLACGVGYAVPILLEGDKDSVVKEYVGVDIDKDSIEYASDHYRHPKARFVVEDACNPKLYQELGLFDCIVSFETIEHLEEDYNFIKNIITMLKPGGVAVISTPFGRGRGIKCSNPYHVHQYTEPEFRYLLSPFRQVRIYHQIDECIEEPFPGKKYYLMVAVCHLL